MSARVAGEPNLAFVDTSGFAALANPRDNLHAAALRVEEQLRRQSWQICSSIFVIAEAHALLLNRSGRRNALNFLEYALSGRFPLIPIEVTLPQMALDLIRRYDDKDFSFTDATSFVLMERLGIRHAFAFDEDFARYGFTLLN